MKGSSKMWIVFVLALFLNGCMADRISEKEIAGRYRAELPDGATESLELLPGGECRQTIRLRTGPVYDARGTWRFDEKKGRLHLKGIRQALTPAKELNPRVSESPTDTTLGTPVSRRLGGGITIMLHEGIYYYREATAH
jgi:hypothetical protein